MVEAKRARTAETPKPPSFDLRLRALYFYPTTQQKPGRIPGEPIRSPLPRRLSPLHPFVPGNGFLLIKRLASLFEVVFGEMIQIAKIPFPRGILIPPDRRLHRRVGRRSRFKYPQRQLERFALRLGIKRFPRCIPQGKITKQEAWNPAMLDDISGTAHNDGCNAMRFEVPGSQTHGLVAHGSIGHQNRRIDRILLAIAP
jgi:hypothetical protein